MPPFRDFTPLFARQPDLLSQIQLDIAAMGLVGEEDSGLLMYCVYSSRKLEKPLCAIVRGPSSSGKDQVQRIPAKLMPPEDVLDYTSITPNALYYGEPGYLKHKIVLGGERRHEEDAAARDKTATVRQLISQGRVTKRSVDIHRQPVELTQEGPISYSETTTKASIFQEDLNRCLQVMTDTSEGLTKKILKSAVSRRSAGFKANREEVVRKHVKFQNNLKAVEVSIPFLDALSDLMPVGDLQVRRVFDQIVSLLEVVAYLHQFGRKLIGGRIPSTVEDYEVVRRLAIGPLHEAVGVSKEKRAEIVQLLEKLPKEFTTTEAIAVLGMSARKTARDLLNRLAGAGAVVKTKEGSGNQPDHWRKTDKPLEHLMLPTVESLRAALLA